MIAKLKQYFSFLAKVDKKQFFRLNYHCRSVIRTDGSKVIPYKHAVFDIDPSAKIYLCGGDLELGCDCFNRSKTETRVRLRQNAVWSLNGGCKISYGSTVEILSDALLDSRYFTMNSGSTLIAAERITLGKDVMMGRSVVVYDSDHHQILDGEGHISNRPAPVEIGDHVWLATHVTVLKGSRIGSNSIVGACSVVRGAVPPDSVCYTDGKPVIRKHEGTWRRESPKENM